MLRNDENYLDAIGAESIPDPTTAGDFCQRFSADDVKKLMDTINDVRIGLWQRQGDEFASLVAEGVPRPDDRSQRQMERQSSG